MDLGVEMREDCSSPGGFACREERLLTIAQQYNSGGALHF
jgi:hypothetical protein